MSTRYEVYVRIAGYNADCEDKILAACYSNWTFVDTDSFEFWTEDGINTIQATGTGFINIAESPNELADRIAKAIWAANNGKYCYIKTQTTCLEDLPSDVRQYDIGDFNRLKRKGRRGRANAV